jgi:hypothetical protein
MEEIKTGVFQITNNNPIYIIGDIQHLLGDLKLGDGIWKNTETGHSICILTTGLGYYKLFNVLTDKNVQIIIDANNLASYLRYILHTYTDNAGNKYTQLNNFTYQIFAYILAMNEAVLRANC